ncbi:Uu.00g090240.m01.CDS01 [Anthostomella pinea]|uniref:Uu.00g090240.m01.CDS01 n=1 Tax=Anthostomella pinea TaxID=933095 RepID=A0AAI8VHF0_9PEZI|nr:Uu.00g090240.m01.CDS01 [Anthostomella pinea]
MDATTTPAESSNCPCLDEVLKWLYERPPSHLVSYTGPEAKAEQTQLDLRLAKIAEAEPSIRLLSIASFFDADSIQEDMFLGYDSIQPTDNAISSPLRRGLRSATRDFATVQSDTRIVAHSRLQTSTSLPHVLALHSTFSQTPYPLRGNLAFAGLLYDVGMELWKRVHIDTGMRVLHTALEVVEETHVQQTAASLSLRADICVALGILCGLNGIESRGLSTKYRHEALRAPKFPNFQLRNDKIDTPVVNDILIQNARSDLAMGWLESEEFGRADSLIEGYLIAYRAWEPTEARLPYEYANYYFVKAVSLMAMGDASQALEKSQRAVELLATVSSGTCLYSHYEFTLVTLQYHARNRRAALRLHREIREERKKTWGIFDSRYLESSSMVARLLYHAKKYDEAW